MQKRAWTLTLMATDDQPTRTLVGVSQEATVQIINELMYGRRATVEEQVAEIARAKRERAAREPIAA